MPTLPADVTPGQLRAFIKSVHTGGGVVHVDKVALDLHWDLTKILPIIDAAEMLGLVVVEKGEAKLSGETYTILGVEQGKMQVLTKCLSLTEPFLTALKFKRKFTAEDLARELSKKGIRWHHEDEINSLLLSELLMQWGIRTEILAYDGSSFALA